VTQSAARRQFILGHVLPGIKQKLVSAWSCSLCSAVQCTLAEALLKVDIRLKAVLTLI
jgi:hypothetical protein